MPGRLLLCLTLLAPVAQSFADAPPQPPCGAAPESHYAPAGPKPTIRLWHADQVETWHLPACLKWRDAKPRVIVETAGRFPHTGDPPGTLGAFGKLSAMKRITYWSVTRQAWKPLFDLLDPVDATTHDVRPDFTVQELQTGLPLFVRQRESHLPGTAIFEMRVTVESEDQFQVWVENVEPIRWMGVTVIEPGHYQFYYAVERDKGDLWRYYNLARVIGGSPALAIIPDASYINRAAAIFRYIAGYPGDIEPPVAPTRTQLTPAH